MAQLHKITQIPKSLTGIHGLDEITLGGLPKYRSTLLAGYAGTGKTLLGLQFLIHGIAQKEWGLFVSFEEMKEDIIKNTFSLEYNLKAMTNKKQLIVHHLHVDRSDYDESGEYNLEGIFIRLGDLIDRYKIKRVVIDGIESIFGQLSHKDIIRSELQRLFQWLKYKQVTSIVTAERGQNTITRYGLEEYVADCVIVLENEIVNKLATRNLRVLKYRGSAHGSNEYPYIIDQKGITVMPITSMTMDFTAPKTFISTGIKSLNDMLNGKGFYKGGSVLLSGASGVGKTNLAAIFAESICKNRGKCLYFAFEESADQIIRNTNSINVDLGKWVKDKKLIFHAVRPNTYGIESHLIKMIRMIDEFNPDAVVIDPITNLKFIDSTLNVKLMLARLINHVKSKKITTLMTSLLTEGSIRGEENVSSIMDTWILLKKSDSPRERSILITINKSRGMPHSREVRQMLITDTGVDIAGAYSDLIQKEGK